MQVSINVPENIPPEELNWKIKEFEKSLKGEAVDLEQEGVLKDSLDKIRSKGTFKHIEDPVAWQEEIRKDRVLPRR